MNGRAVVAFCGLGNPDAFRSTLADLGATVLAFRTYPDHHPYTRDDVEALRAWAATFPAQTHVVTTQKDWVKLRTPDLAGRLLLALRVGFAFETGEAELLARLDSMLPQPVDE